MVFINCDDLGTFDAYQKFRYDVMKSAWGASKEAYLSSDGVPMIGTNVSLRSSNNMELAAGEMIGGAVPAALLRALNAAASNTYNTDKQLQNALDAVMKDWHDNNDPSVPAEFQFETHAQMRRVLNSSDEMTTAENEFEARIADSNFDNLEERAAIVALAYDEPDLLDEGIMDALLQGVDRFQAWYAMRYATNIIGGQNAKEKADTAFRHYVESDYFELYNDPAHVGFAEAHQVALGYQAARNQILAYEDKYAPPAAANGVANAAGGLIHGSINDQLQPTIKAVAKHYDLAIGHLEEVLFVKASNAVLNGDGTAFDTAGNNDDLLIGDSEDNVIHGNEGNDVIAGLAGDDRLFGETGDDRLHGGNDNDKLSGAGGNDRLYGGAGGDTLDGDGGRDQIDGDDGDDLLKGGLADDVLNGGDGDDRLFGGDGDDRLTGGQGRDRLVGGDGDDTYVLTPTSKSTGPVPGGGPNPSLAGGANDDVIVEENNGGKDTVIIDMSGNFDIRNVELMTMTGDFTGKVFMALNQFDKFTLSNKADDLTLTINKLQKQPIDIVTGGGADTVHIRFAPGVDPSQVLDHQGLTARFDFADLGANDTIDLSSIGIKKIVTNDLNISVDQGYYLMAPDAQIHLVKNGNETKTYTNDTDSWFVVRCGDNTPYGPEFFGNVHKDNFDI